MKPQIKIDRNSPTPVYKQLIESVLELIENGEYKDEDFLPSMNELSSELEISKATVKKAYSMLREKEAIDSAHGKGFYVTKKNSDTLKLLLLFDKISTYKQVLFNSFAEQIRDISEITIRLHNQDVEVLENFIEDNLDNFDYYVITPHFPLEKKVQKRALKALKRIPNRKLILLDHNIQELEGNFGAVYQDFENDIIDGLSQATDDLKKFKKLNVVSMPSSMYASVIKKGIEKFCIENSIDFEIFKKIAPEKIQKDEVYLILNGQLDYELIELIKTAKAEGCKIGEDIGIISYNESPINEIILDGLTCVSTDFKQMGRLASKMIMDKSFKKIRCDFKMIRRNTF